MKVTLYTRRGCHLCEEAERVIAEVASGAAQIEILDIDDDPTLTDRYTVRVPVVEVDGVEIAQYEVDRGVLAAALNR